MNTHDQAYVDKDLRERARRRFKMLLERDAPTRASAKRRATLAENLARMVAFSEDDLRQLAEAAGLSFLRVDGFLREPDPIERDRRVAVELLPTLSRGLPTQSRRRTR